jgi:hypothetical protein
MRIAVKYCGNCNPEINSPRIIGHWMETIRDDEIIFHPEGRQSADLLIIICGCRKACVDRPEIREMGKEIILIKGKWIDAHPSGEDELAEKLIQRVDSTR